MKSEKRKFRHESIEDSQSIARYLDALRDGFANGSIRLADEDGEMLLTPEGLVRLELSVSRKRDRVRVKVELSWRRDEAESGQLQIEAIPADDA